MFHIIPQPLALVTILLVSVTSVTNASVPLASQGSSAKTGHPESPWWTTYREKFLPSFYKEIVGALILKQLINKNQSMLFVVHRLDLTTTNKTFRKKLETPQKLNWASRDQ